MKNAETIMINERGFRYIALHSGSHNHRETRLWLNAAINDDGNNGLEFPIRDAVTSVTERGGNFVIRPAVGQVVYLIEVSSGYRGGASIETITGGEIVATGQSYHSGAGSLGETAWAVVNATGPVVVSAHITGRRVDKNDVSFRLYPDGREEDASEDDLAEALN